MDPGREFCAVKCYGQVALKTGYNEASLEGYPMRNCSRREFLSAAGMAAGAYFVRPNLLAAERAPAGRVAIGLCTEYDRRVEIALAAMFDQLGGLDRLVGGKTVAIKLNMTGTPDTRFNGMPVE